MPIINGQVVPWRTKELLPDGRWQHFCSKCNAPHTQERWFNDPFDYKLPCEKCDAKSPPTFFRLQVSSCE